MAGLTLGCLFVVAVRVEADLQMFSTAKIRTAAVLLATTFAVAAAGPAHATAGTEGKSYTSSTAPSASVGEMKSISVSKSTF